MIRAIALLIVCLGLSRAAVALDPQEERLGFVFLFDGETFEGWNQQGNWVIERGAFYRKQAGGPLTYTAAEVPFNSTRPLADDRRQ